MIRLRTLGQLELEYPDGESGGGLVRAPKRLAILVYLAADPDKMVRRDVLLPLFWPESDQAGARHALRNVLYEMRQDLGKDVIRSRGTEDLGVDSELLVCDAVEFQRALAAGQAERAVSLYQGDFLAGFHLRDAAPEFDVWVEQQRETLRRGYAAALEELAKASQAAGAHGPAARWWRRLARHDPFSGRVALRLLQALEAAGEKAEALRYAERHARLLRDELGAVPDPDVEAAAERIRRGEPGPERPAAGAAPAASRPAPPGTPDRPTENAEEPTPPPGAPDRLPENAERPRGPTGRRRSVGAAAAILVALALALAGRAFVGGSEPRADREIRRIAVLPLTNLTGDAEQDYFAAAMTEQLITQFAQVHGLQVVARTAVLRYEDRAVPIREISRELGVDAVIAGSVIRAGNEVRISAQLIDGETEAHLWAKDYTRDFQDLLALEKDVAREITREVGVNLSLEEEARLEGSRPVSPEAQAAFLRGVYLQRRYQDEGGSDTTLEQSVLALSRAVELEPDWAEAHAELARAYHWLASGPPSPRMDEYYRKAKEEAQTAIRLDETLAAGHAALAFVMHAYERDWAGAEREYRRALELAPHDNYYRWGWAIFELSAARYDDAAADFRRALEHSPLSPALHAQLVHALVCDGRYGEALAITDLYDQDEVAYHRGQILLRLGETRRGVTQLERAVELSDSGTTALAALAHAYAVAGREQDARALIPELEAREAWMPAVYAELGDGRRAMDELELAYQQHRIGLLAIRCLGGASFTNLTTVDALAEQPGFQDLLRRIGFPR